MLDIGRVGLGRRHDVVIHLSQPVAGGLLCSSALSVGLKPAEDAPQLLSFPLQGFHQARIYRARWIISRKTDIYRDKNHQTRLPHLAGSAASPSARRFAHVYDGRPLTSLDLQTDLTSLGESNHGGTVRRI